MKELKDLTVLRLHFYRSAFLKSTRFWHRLTAPVLSHHPLCLALIDLNERLPKFLPDHADERKRARITVSVRVGDMTAMGVAS